LPPDTWANLVVNAWQHMGLKLNKGATDTDLMQAQEQLAYQFDPFFTSLYSRTNGFAQDDWIGHLITFWPLSRIVSEAGRHWEYGFIAFGDYMISSAEYGFMKSEPGVFKLYDLADAHPEKLTSLFSEFVLLVNREDVLIY
jgi:hypothetical protein